MSVFGNRNTQDQRPNLAMQSQSSPPSYARAVQKEVCPTRNQAIIIDSIDGLTIRDYALAIGGIIGPSNMLSISRISQNRICIYLVSEEKADELVKTHKTVIINGHSLTIRPLNTKTVRILISNVHTSIPNEAIEYILNKYHVTPKSQITRLKTGLHDAGYTHLLSHRRQVYIDPSDVNKIPQSAQLIHDNITYWIYFSNEKLTCFLCKEEGHLAKHCKNSESSSQNIELDTSETEKDNLQFPLLNNTNLLDDATTTQPSYHTLKINTRKRHPANASLTVTENSSEPNTVDTNNLEILTTEDTEESQKKRVFKQPKKKIKIGQDPITDAEILKDIEMQLQPIEASFSKKFTDSEFDKIKMFLYQTFGQKDVKQIALACQISDSSANSMLTELHDNLGNGNLRKRIRRILSKLEDPSSQFNLSDSASEE